MRSAIYLPAITVGTAPDELLALILEEPDLIDRIVGSPRRRRAHRGRRLRPRLQRVCCSKYQDTEVEAAAQAALDLELSAEKHRRRTTVVDEQTEEQFRRAEAAVLDDALQ